MIHVLENISYTVICAEFSGLSTEIDFSLGLFLREDTGTQCTQEYISYAEKSTKLHVIIIIFTMSNVGTSNLEAGRMILPTYIMLLSTYIH